MAKKKQKQKNPELKTSKMQFGVCKTRHNQRLCFFPPIFPSKSGSTPAERLREVAYLCKPQSLTASLLANVSSTARDPFQRQKGAPVCRSSIVPYQLTFQCCHPEVHGTKRWVVLGRVSKRVPGWLTSEQEWVGWGWGVSAEQEVDIGPRCQLKRQNVFGNSGSRETM